MGSLVRARRSNPSGASRRANGVDPQRLDAQPAAPSRQTRWSLSLALVARGALAARSAGFAELREQTEQVTVPPSGVSADRGRHRSTRRRSRRKAPALADHERATSVSRVCALFDSGATLAKTLQHAFASGLLVWA